MNNEILREICICMNAYIIYNGNNFNTYRYFRLYVCMYEHNIYSELIKCESMNFINLETTCAKKLH